MKNKMEEIDQLIKESLSEEEAKFYDNLDEQNVFQMLGGVFHGKNRWIMLLFNVFTFVFLGMLIYCIVQFFNTEVTNELIKWSVAGIICVMAVSMLKLFIWMQMDKNAILREMKRLELQVSSLSGNQS